VFHRKKEKLSLERLGGLVGGGEGGRKGFRGEAKGVRERLLGKLDFAQGQWKRQIGTLCSKGRGGKKMQLT